MFTLPNLHDGFLDGVLLSKDKSAYLFVRTVTSERFTIVLKAIEALNITNFWVGNIILDIEVIHPDKLTHEQIRRAYPVAETEAVAALVVKAQQKGLWALEITPSFGAECAFLFASAEILPTYVFPEFRA